MGRAIAVIIVIIIIIIIIVIYMMSKERLDSLPDASTMVFGVLPRSKTVSQTVAAGGWTGGVAAAH
jgi:hypothetical protein